MNLQELTAAFAIPDVLSFAKTEHGLFSAAVSTPTCTAEIYLQGAHLTQWHPGGGEPVLFLSARSAFMPGKAIRGGIPIIFPWFGARTATPYSSRTDGPSHGFARTSEWQITDVTMSGGDLHLTLVLDPNDLSRSLGYDSFRLTYKLILGSELRLELTIENQSPEPILCEEALHSYFLVGDAKQITIKGLAGTHYLDKTNAFKRMCQEEPSLSLTGETDRPYLDTAATVYVDDPVLGRRIIVEKENSKTTVIWNPWSELTAKLPDMSADGWLHMTCVETANALENAVSLAPGEQHTMRARVKLDVCI